MLTLRTICGAGGNSMSLGYLHKFSIFSHLRLMVMMMCLLRLRRIAPWKSAIHILDVVSKELDLLLGSWWLKHMIEIRNVADRELEDFNLREFLVGRQSWQEFSQLGESDIECLDANSFARCMCGAIFLRCTSTSCDEKRNFSRWNQELKYDLFYTVSLRRSSRVSPLKSTFVPSIETMLLLLRPFWVVVVEICWFTGKLALLKFSQLIRSIMSCGTQIAVDVW